MSKDMDIENKLVKSSSILCAICGDNARGMNFNVLTCVSCKAFFRRNVFRIKEIRRCPRKTLCHISKQSRALCACCRLTKCFLSGMNPLLIQSNALKEMDWKIIERFIQNRQKMAALPAPKPLSLLRNDRSLLTKDEWELVSNIIRSYDEQNIMNRVRNLLKEKSSLPLKLRLKSSDTIDYLSRTYKRVLPLLEHSPHLLSLSSNAQQTILKHNVLYTASLNGYFIGYETDSFRHPTYMSACSALFGREFMNRYARDNQRLLSNGNLYKLLLFVLIFSSNISVVMYDEHKHLDANMEDRSAVELFHAESIYISMLWKYLVYLYGVDGSVIYFNRMIKNILDMFARIEELLKDATYEILANAIASQVNDSLLLKDREI